MFWIEHARREGLFAPNKTGPKIFRVITADDPGTRPR